MSTRYLCLLAASDISLASLQVVHLIFKRTETYEPTRVVPLSLGVPTLLTYLYRPHASSVLWAAVTVFNVFFVSLFTSIALYRVSPWHPLAKYPGPLICKLTQFHLATLSLRGKQHIYFAKLHEKYGDIVRVGEFHSFTHPGKSTKFEF